MCRRPQTPAAAAPAGSLSGPPGRPGPWRPNTFVPSGSCRPKRNECRRPAQSGPGARHRRRPGARGELDLESVAERGQPGDGHGGLLGAAEERRVDRHDAGELRLRRIPWMMMPPERLRLRGRQIVKESHAATLSPPAACRNRLSRLAYRGGLATRPTVLSSREPGAEGDQRRWLALWSAGAVTPRGPDPVRNPGCDLHAGAETELVENVVDVALHGPAVNEQLLANLFVAPARRY